MFQFTRPEDSDDAFDELVTKAENLVKGLGFHFRTVKLAAGDCSASMARTYDIEIQIPSMQGTRRSPRLQRPDYQARPGNIRFRREATGKPEFLHTLNGSGLATSRIFPAMVEQNQLKDGSVKVPEVLQKYLGGLEVISKSEGARPDWQNAEGPHGKGDDDGTRKAKGTGGGLSSPGGVPFSASAVRGRGRASPEKEPYRPYSRSTRIKAWIGIAFMVFLVIMYTYAFASGKIMAF